MTSSSISVASFGHFECVSDPPRGLRDAWTFSIATQFDNWMKSISIDSSPSISFISSWWKTEKKQSIDVFFFFLAGTCDSTVNNQLVKSIIGSFHMINVELSMQRHRRRVASAAGALSFTSWREETHFFFSFIIFYSLFFLLLHHLLVLLRLLLGPCPLLLLLFTAATMLAKSSSNSTKGCSCNCSLTSSTRTTWPMIRWGLWQSKWKIHKYWKEPDMPSAAAAVFPLSPRFPLLDSWFLCVVFFPRPIE